MGFGKSYNNRVALLDWMIEWLNDWMIEWLNAISTPFWQKMTWGILSSGI